MSRVHVPEPSALSLYFAELSGQVGAKVQSSGVADCDVMRPVWAYTAVDSGSPAMPRLPQSAWNVITIFFVSAVIIAGLVVTTCAPAVGGNMPSDAKSQMAPHRR